MTRRTSSRPIKTSDNRSDQGLMLIRRAPLRGEPVDNGDSILIPARRSGGVYRRATASHCPVARDAEPIDTSASHVGFRCITPGGSRS